jgi:hypothetical protein
VYGLEKRIMKKKVTRADETKEINKKKLLEALEHHLGVASAACRMAKVTRPTFYNYLKEDAEFKAKVDEIQEVAIDFVESQLFEQIRNGQPSSTIFYLKTKGKKRGYIEKSEVDMNVVGGVNLTIEKTYDSDSETD